MLFGIWPPGIPPQVSEDSGTSEFLNQFESWQDQINNCPLIRGRLVEVTLPALTWYELYHGLTDRDGKPTPYLGYIVAGQDTIGDLINDYDDTNKDQYIRLTAEYGGKFTLWVF